MAKKVVFSDLPISQWQAGDTVAVFRNGKVVRIPVFGQGDIPEFPKLATVATSGKYSDLTGRPILGTAASKNEGDFATAEQGSKGVTAYLWGNHAQAGYALASAVTAANIKTLYESNTNTNAFTDQQKADLESVFSWGDHRMQGYVLSADGRLSNAREWTASIVSQSEAEAGTATTARKWTAQRVRQAVLAWWAGSDDKAKLDGVAVGATKNATDVQLRDRSTHTGMQAISTVSGLQTALDGKVDNSDNRLTNSREWTGSTVSQAEAEAGIATARRAWTAQRVRQAIAAWWATVTLNASDIQGLGTAATTNLGTGSNDAARGNHNHSQYWDIVNPTGYAPTKDLNEFVAGEGGYVRTDRNPNAPTTGLDVITKQQYGSTDLLQIAFPQRTVEEMYMRTAQGGTWRDWIRFWHSRNFDPTTKLDLTAFNSRTITAGNGMTGGGNLSANRTITLGTPSDVSASSINSVNSTSHTHALSAEVKASLAKADSAMQPGAFGLGGYSPKHITSEQGFIESAANNTTEFIWNSTQINVAGKAIPAYSAGIRVSRNGSAHGVKIMAGSNEMIFGRDTINTVWHDNNFNPATKMDKSGGMFTGNVLFGGDGNFSTSATIAVAIGDSDTGFKWVSDGKYQLYANAQAVAEVSRDSLNALKPLLQNGQQVWYPGNFNPNTKVDKSGDTLTGKLNLAASTTAGSSLNIPTGTAPSSPVHGDIWTTASAVMVRLGTTTRTLAHTASWSQVSQAEAEAGTATTNRLWTALRVRQSTAAYTYSKAEIDIKINAVDHSALTLAQAQAAALYF